MLASDVASLPSGVELKRRIAKTLQIAPRIMLQAPASPLEIFLIAAFSEVPDEFLVLDEVVRVPERDIGIVVEKVPGSVECCREARPAN
jgi:hypothetical protein